MHPAFELQPAEDAVAGDGGDDLLVAAGVALGHAVDIHPPAARGGVARIHAEQVASEQGRLVPAGAGAHLQHGRGVLVRIARRQQQGDLTFQLGQAVGQGAKLVLGHGRHFRVGRHRLQVRHLGADARQALDGVGDRLQFGVLLGQAHDLGPVGRRAHAGFDLVETVEYLIETGLGQSQEEDILRERE